MLREKTEYGRKHKIVLQHVLFKEIYVSENFFPINRADTPQLRASVRQVGHTNDILNET